MKLKLLLLLPLLAALAIGQELLTNGNFEQDLTVGWTMTYGGTGTPTVNRDPTYQPDPDYEALVQWYDNPGWVDLSQTVDVPGAMTALSFWAKFYQTGETTCWPAACFELRYYDAASTLLGRTRYYYSSVTPWTATATFHPIVVTNPDWTQYQLSIAQELSANLPGVNPANLAKIGVALFDTTEGG